MRLLGGINGKLLMMLVLILVMLIPMGMVESLVEERQSYKEDAVRDVTSKWGTAQVITGPVLSIPWRSQVVDKDNNVREVLHRRHILPDSLDIRGKLTTEVRQRGIYEVVLYNLQLDIKGTLASDLAAQMEVADEDILWDQASIWLGITDMAGIRQRIELTVADWQAEMEPGLPNHDLSQSGVSIRVPDIRLRDGAAFHVRLDLDGSDRVRFMPVARTNQVQLSSEWASPAFAGAFLPEQHNSGPQGFTADWQVLNLNRNYPQAWNDTEQKIADSAFGVDLYIAADIYQQSMRSIKYALLFILAAFGVFFSFELVRGNRVHPFQYSLIGIAVSVFYLLLLSFSEHLGFDLAYLLAAVAITAMIGLYGVAVFRQARAGWVIAGLLALLYGYLYALLQLQDYALLVGSLGLFVGLAALMYISRKIDWYGLVESGSQER